MEISVEEYLHQNQDETGWVIRWDEERSFGVISNEWEKRFVTIRTEIEANGLGQRFLIPGEQVSFTPGTGPSGKFDRAKNVRLLERPPIAIPNGYREIVTVTKWDGRAGFARREVGGFVSIKALDIISEGIRDLEVGSKLLVRPVRPRYHPA